MKEKFGRSFSKILQQFPDGQFLLGLSGGADSLVLFHLLLEQRIKFAIAHVNHRWRQESDEEAHSLEQLAKEHNVPFHLKSLNPATLSGNLEAACRDERLNFFRELSLAHNYQAVLLAHHADDQSETVLKRILEGASLQRLQSLKELTKLKGVTVCRPLLQFTKAEILNYVKEHELQPFEDATNHDPKYLRARFRTQIIPELTKSFGKNISQNLCYLAQETQEMREFLSSHLSSILNTIQETPEGQLLDLAQAPFLSTFELKFILKEWLQQEDVMLSRVALQQSVEFILANAANKYVSLGSKKLYINRKRVFLIVLA